jgi:hypothetical protein
MPCCPSARLSLVSGLVVLTLSPATNARAPEHPVRATPELTMTILRGCVNGATLTNVIEPDGDRASSPVYRMTGPKTLLHQIRGEHNGHRIEVTGSIRDADDPRVSVRRTKKVGKGRLYVGARQGTPEQLGTPLETPHIDVVEFRHVSKSCKS